MMSDCNGIIKNILILFMKFQYYGINVLRQIFFKVQLFSIVSVVTSSIVKPWWSNRQFSVFDFITRTSTWKAWKRVKKEV